MCVIIIKPAGVEMPSEQILRQAYRANPDGCGFVSDTNYYRTMNFDKFMKKLKKCSNDENVIIHFRLATHGSVRLGNCHPFTDRKGLYFAHNGILNVAPYGDMTDSETAFIRHISPACRKFGYKSKKFDEICKCIAGGSRFAFLKNGVIKTIGEYYKYKGCMYSNTRFVYNNFLSFFSA